MKTFRLIGMALLAVVLCVNFIACSKDAEVLTDNDIITKSKKLIGMKETEDNQTHILDFSYDAEGKLSSIVHSYMSDGNNEYQQVIRFTWSSFTITAESDNSYLNRTYTLDNNPVQTIRGYKATDWSKTQLSYNSSNQLLMADNDSYYLKYIWDNEKILKIESKNIYDTDITYSGKTCKGYFPLYNDFDDIFYAHPELIGLRNLQLPEQKFDKYGDSEYTEEYTYTFDKDGYVKSCTIVETEKNLSSNYTNTDTTIFTFKWE